MVRLLKTRIFFVPGCWQLMVAVAALRSTPSSEPTRDVLCLYAVAEDLPMHGELPVMAQRLHAWDEIIWLNEEMQRAPLDPSLARADIQDRLHACGVDQGHEVWVCKIQAQAEKAVVSIFPTAGIVLYEAGMETYLEHSVLCGGARFRSLSPRQWPGALRRELSHCTSQSQCLELVGWCARDVKRLQQVYLALSDTLPLPENLQSLPCEKIATKRLLGTIQDLQIPKESACIPHQAAWVVGQNFSEGKEMLPEEEYAMYRRVCGALIKQGLKVVWIDHPRTLEPLVPKLEKEYGKERLHGLQSRGYPLESFIFHYEPALIASASSTALLYARLLFEVEAYTFQEIRGPWRSPVLDRIATLVAGTIPSMALMMNCPARKAGILYKLLRDNHDDRTY